MSDENRPDQSEPLESAPSGNGGGGQTPAAADGGETPATQFRQEVASRQSSLDDYEPEEDLWSGGYSPRAMFGMWALMIAITIGLLVAAALVPNLTWTLAIGLIILMWLVGICWYGSRRLGVHYQLTTQRFIHRIGLLTHRTDRIEVIDIDDVSYKQGPVQRALGIGSIVITSSDRTHPELTMIGIENVQEVAGLIDDIRRKERRKRSLHIEAI